MFWEKKKKEVTLPDLPFSLSSKTPASFATPQKLDAFDEESVHELPSFPDSPMQQGFSQTAIKEAVANEDTEDEHELPELRKEEKNTRKGAYNIVEMEEWKPKPLPSLASPSSMRENKPIFVRIDKFQLARNSLETAKLKLSEIEDLLKQIRDVKAKEDIELSSWESELENIKTRIQNVISDIFDKTED